jgi:outer membrane immunogenic protein
MKEVAPAPPPPCFNWTGFYVGGFGGYKHSNVDVDLDLGGDWITNGLDIKHSIEDHGTGSLDADGAEAGGLIGYNYQWHCWVFGLEGDGGYLWLRNSDSTGSFIPTGGSLHRDIETSFKTRYLFTFGPRLGYAFGRWLPYVTGGLAVGDLGFSQELHDVEIFFREGGSTDETHAGWMVGSGLQYALNDHWSVRAQYQYVDLGSVSFSYSGSAGFEGYTGSSAASLKEHNASFAIMYKF